MLCCVCVCVTIYLQDDFYLNLVDWSPQNQLAVGLGSCVYLWSACTSKVTKLCDLSSPADDTICSVAWSMVTGPNFYFLLVRARPPGSR